MNRHEYIPVTVVSLLLLVYCILIGFQLAPTVIIIIFIASPFLVIWLVYQVIRYGKQDVPKLPEDDEWGYADTSKEDLDTFRNN